MKKLPFVLLFIIFQISRLFSDNISISGIDSTGLMFDGQVGLFLTVTDHEGEPLKGLLPENVKVYESLDNNSFNERKISSLSAGLNKNKGISFQLLVDNSGSMYDKISGKETDVEEERRIYSAVSAIKTLIDSMKGSKDRAGISLFNTYYTELVSVGSNRNLVSESLQKIEKPGKDESFTELNAALYTAAENNSLVRGRKIIIVLSDGENYPYSIVREEDNPQFGSKLYSMDEVIEILKQNSTTLYGINYGTEKDPELEKVALATGGLLFKAETEENLTQIYKSIRKRVLNEYYLKFKTDTEYSDRKYVKTILTNELIESGSIYYFCGTLFGNPSESFNILYFIVAIGAFLVLFILGRLKFSEPVEKAGLEVWDNSGKTQIFDLESNKTVIGNNDSDDITMVTDHQSEENNATIIFDDKKSAYTVISDKEVLVNNNPVKTRILEAGDVISIDGATIIFNDKE